MYDETRELGRRFGLRDRDMPESLPAFREWYADIVENRLEDNPTVRDFLEVMSAPPPPQAGQGTVPPRLLSCSITP